MAEIKKTGPDGWDATYKGNLFLVERNELGWERASRPPGTRTIILSEDRTKILLTKEVRSEHGAEPDWRLPGGKVADSWAEYQALLESGTDLLQSAEQGALLETRQEAGIEVVKLTYLDKRPCGGKINWNLYYFVAEEWQEHPDGQALEEHEVIETEWVHIDEAVRLIFEGRFNEDRSAAVLLRYLFQQRLIEQPEIQV